MSKQCLRCMNLLPLDKFHKHSKTKDGVRTQCKECRSKYAASDRVANYDKYLENERKRRDRNAESIKVSNKKYMQKSSSKGKRLAYMLERDYGITITQYDTMYEEQQGRCKICGLDQERLDRRLCVDHCHVTGKVRGLLCDPCNRLLGQAKDRIHVLLKAAEYLKEANDTTIP